MHSFFKRAIGVRAVQKGPIHYRAIFLLTTVLLALLFSRCQLGFCSTALPFKLLDVSAKALKTARVPTSAKYHSQPASKNSYQTN